MTCFLLYGQANVPDAPLLELWPGKSGPFVTERPDFVVQWGEAGLSACERHTVVLNGKEALKNATDSTITAKMLADSGIPHSIADTSATATIRRYIAIVFQQDMISLYRSSGRRLWLNNRVKEGEDRYEEIEVEQKMREMRRLKQYAIRSVHTLGLDFAAVYLGVDMQGTMRVLNIAPTFRMTRMLARKFISHLENFRREYSASDVPIMLGTDIEFILRNRTGKLVLASDCFPKEGRVGCDRVCIRGDETKELLPLAELRPDPAADARDLFRNLYRTMMAGIRKTGSPHIEWVAGGMPLTGYPMGGHIHFSGPVPNAQWLRALDGYLALSVFMLESPRSLARRPRYGQLGDMRYQFHGGFEYRTLPSFLVSPKVTRGVLALSHLIAVSYRGLRTLPFLDPEMHHAFYHGDRDTVAPLVPRLWDELRETEMYAHYATYLDPFAQQVLSRTQWDEYSDIRPAWKLPPFQPETTVFRRAYEHSML